MFTIVGVIIGGIAEGAFVGSDVGPLGILAGMFIGGFAGYLHRDSQITEKYDLLAKQLARRYSNAAANTVFNAAKAKMQDEIDYYCDKYIPK